MLTGLFDRVGLCTNVNKMLGMVFHPFKISDRQLEVAYTRQKMGVGTSFQER